MQDFSVNIRCFFVDLALLNLNHAKRQRENHRSFSSVLLYFQMMNKNSRFTCKKNDEAWDYYA